MVMEENSHGDGGRQGMSNVQVMRQFSFGEVRLDPGLERYFSNTDLWFSMYFARWMESVAA
jgi:hypothetical protein